MCGVSATAGARARFLVFASPNGHVICSPAAQTASVIAATTGSMR
jgi:hypothetical protein